MLKKLLKSISIIALFGICQPCFAKHNNTVIEDYVFNNYELHLVKKVHNTTNEFTIKKNGKVVFESINELSNKITLKQGYDLTEVTPNHKLNSPILIFEEIDGTYLAGLRTIIFSLGADFKTLGKFSGVVIVMKKDHKKDGFEIIKKDDSLIGVWDKSSNLNNDSDKPELIYGLIDGYYRLDYNKMKKAPIPESELQRIIFSINRINYKDYIHEELQDDKVVIHHHFKYIDSPYNPSDYFNIPTNTYFENSIIPILKLIYSDNCKQAHEVIDKTWPGTSKEKALFLADLKKRLIKELKDSPEFISKVIKKL